jgi:hypothetical protein
MVTITVVTEEILTCLIQTIQSLTIQITILKIIVIIIPIYNILEEILLNIWMDNNYLLCNRVLINIMVILMDNINKI